LSWRWLPWRQRPWLRARHCACRERYWCLHPWCQPHWQCARDGRCWSRWRRHDDCRRCFHRCSV
ncbi:hypothetical protein E4U36_007767, partial [Claviceps purpurea]